MDNSPERFDPRFPLRKSEKEAKVTVALEDVPGSLVTKKDTAITKQSCVGKNVKNECLTVFVKDMN